MKGHRFCRRTQKEMGGVLEGMCIHVFIHQEVLRLMMLHQANGQDTLVIYFQWKCLNCYMMTSLFSCKKA